MRFNTNPTREHLLHRAAAIAAQVGDTEALKGLPLKEMALLGFEYADLEVAMRAVHTEFRASSTAVGADQATLWGVHCRDHGVSTDHSFFTLLNQAKSERKAS